MIKLTDKKAIADFKKKHMDAARERWLHPTKPVITTIQKLIAGPGDLLRLLAAGLLLWAVSKKAIEKVEKSKS